MREQELFLAGLWMLYAIEAANPGSVPTLIAWRHARRARELLGSSHPEAPPEDNRRVESRQIESQAAQPRLLSGDGSGSQPEVARQSLRVESRAPETLDLRRQISCAISGDSQPIKAITRAVAAIRLETRATWEKARNMDEVSSGRIPKDCRRGKY